MKQLVQFAENEKYGHIVKNFELPDISALCRDVVNYVRPTNFTTHPKSFYIRPPRKSTLI